MVPMDSEERTLCGIQYSKKTVISYVYYP